MARPQKERRRAPRYDVRIEVVLRGKDEGGRDFFDRREIILIDLHGARVRTRFRLKPRTEIRMDLRGKDVMKLMRVVWTGKEGSFEVGLVGFEFADSNASWDIDVLPPP